MPRLSTVGIPVLQGGEEVNNRILPKPQFAERVLWQMKRLY